MYIYTKESDVQGKKTRSTIEKIQGFDLTKVGFLQLMTTGEVIGVVAEGGFADL